MFVALSLALAGVAAGVIALYVTGLNVFIIGAVLVGAIGATLLRRTTWPLLLGYACVLTLGAALNLRLPICDATRITACVSPLWLVTMVLGLIALGASLLQAKRARLPE